MKVFHYIMGGLLGLNLLASFHYATYEANTFSLKLYYGSAILVDLMIFYYVLRGYKNTKENLIKYVFLLYGIYVIDWVIYMPRDIYYYIPGLLAFAGVISVYIAGNLENARTNVLWIVAALDIELVYLILSEVFMPDEVREIVNSMGATRIIVTRFVAYGVVIEWICLSLAYVARIKKHNEMGENDNSNIDEQNKKERYN